MERADGGFRVTARKPFGSGSPKGGVLVTSAPFEDPKEGWQVLHFAVPFAAPGVSLADDWQTLGMRATGSHTIILDNVFVPDDAVALRRPRGRFHPAWNVILTVAMPLIMSVYAGVAEAAAAIGKEQAKKRQGDPTVPYLLGELTNQLTMVQLAMDDMVRLGERLGLRDGPGPNQCHSGTQDDCCRARAGDRREGVGGGGRRRLLPQVRA